MKPLDNEQALTLREIFISKISSLPFNQKGWTMSVFDLAIKEFNRLAVSTIQHRAVARRCDGCGCMSLKGTYRNGKRKFFCPDCSKQKGVEP